MSEHGHRVASLLDLDPDLGEFLDAEARESARHQLVVPVRRLAAGPWDTASLTVADPGHVGLLLLDGVIAREVLAADIVSTELIGPGEILRPWTISPDPSLLEVEVRWNVLTEARLAVLDRRLAGHLSEFPEITSQLVERLNKRSQRLAVTQAISQLNRVDQRLLTLFWHLAERWGRMTADGVLIPLTISHRMLSQLIGARRPTVSTAVGELTRAGEIQRLDNGTWLLTGRPVGQPDARSGRLVPPRRRFQPAEETKVAELHPQPSPSHPGAALSARLGSLREAGTRMSGELADAADVTAELFRRTERMRARRAGEQEASVPPDLR